MAYQLEIDGKSERNVGMTLVKRTDLEISAPQIPLFNRIKMTLCHKVSYDADGFEDSHTLYEVSVVFVDQIGTPSFGMSTDWKDFHTSFETRRCQLWQRIKCFSRENQIDIDDKTTGEMCRSVLKFIYRYCEQKGISIIYPQKKKIHGYRTYLVR